MKIKSIITIALLAFVAFSIIFLVARESGLTGRTKPESATEKHLSERSNQIVAYYFHGIKRCPTCLEIEALAQDAVENIFSEELEGGRLVWEVINYEQYPNEHFVAEFELVVSSLILAEYHGGELIEWKNLEKVWDLVWEAEDFTYYVQSEIASFLDRTAEDIPDQNGKAGEAGAD